MLLRSFFSRLLIGLPFPLTDIKENNAALLWVARVAISRVKQTPAPAVNIHVNLRQGLLLYGESIMVFVCVSMLSGRVLKKSDERSVFAP